MPEPSSDCRDPVVLPLYHSGMGDVQPKGSTVPRVGRRVTVTVGEPLDLRDVTCRCNDAGEDQRQVCQQSRRGARLGTGCTADAA